DADAHRLPQLAAHLRREAELAEEPDDRPRADLVRERRDQPAVHDPRRTLKALARRHARHDLVALAHEREVEAERVVRRATEARLTRSEDRSVEGLAHGARA